MQALEKNQPFQKSLSALAQVAMREAGADGYAFFRKAETDSFERQCSGGKVIKESSLGSNDAVVIYSLGTECILVFSFPAHAHVAEIRPRLDPIAETIEAVWRAGHTSEGYAQLVKHVAELETSLMDSKIADRALGFLEHRGHDPIDVIVRHVEGVLRETPTRRTLEQISQDLAQEVEERRLVGKAKAILQSTQEMSEQEAHAHLRLVSRQSRRRLKDVAQDVIQQHPVEERVHP